MQPFTKILVPTDFSEGSQLAIERALDLRQRYGATLTLIHVYQLPISYPDGYVFTASIISSIEESARTEMAKTQQQVTARAQELAGAAPVPPIATKVVIGAPAQAIADEAQTGSYDLVVMGTHGRTGLSRLFLGSVAERVLRLAPCAVLTVR